MNVTKPSGAPLVSVLIVTWNPGAHLTRCLAALDAQTLRDFEVVIWDNASTDGSLDAVEDCPGRSVIRHTDNLGFAKANNHAAERAVGRYLVTLNPDAFPEPNWLAALVAAAERHPEAGSIGSTQLLDEDPTRLDGAGDPYTLFGAAWRGGRGRFDRPVPEGSVFGVCAAAALYRREAFDAVGGFEERFFCFYEDVDLAARLRLAGWDAIQLPDARVRHVGSASAPSPFVLRYATRNRVWTLIRCMPGVLLWLGALLAIPLALLSLVFGAFRGQAGARSSALIEALRHLSVCLQERREIQGNKKTSIAAYARALTWSPLRYLRRSIDVRVAETLPTLIPEPPEDRKDAKVVAVIVSYHPDEAIDDVIAAAVRETDHVVLVENGSGPETADRLRRLIPEDQGEVLVLVDNVGLAAAQNAGLTRARSLAADWILLLDDDSVADPGMVGTMLDRWRGLDGRASVGLLTPRLSDHENTLRPVLLAADGRLDLRRQSLEPGAIVRNGVFAIASGSLVRARVLDVVGVMPAEFFIDYVDIEFSLRLRRAGFEIVGIGDTCLRHRLGEFHETRVLGKAVALNTHAAWRRYYIHRNRVRVWKAYGFDTLGWLAWDVVAAVYDVWKAAIYEDDKRAKLWSILRGQWDGWRS